MWTPKTKHSFLPDRGFDRSRSVQEDRLWVADPKAIAHILHGDVWVRTVTNREINAVLLDRGLLWAEGDAHRRQRKTLTPAFGLSESKALMPRFLSVANKVRTERRRLRMLLPGLMSRLTLISRFHFAYSWSTSGRTCLRMKLQEVHTSWTCRRGWARRR